MQQRSPSSTGGHKKGSSSTVKHPHLHNDTLSMRESPPSVSTLEQLGKNKVVDDEMDEMAGYPHSSTSRYAYSNHSSTGTTPSSLPLDVLFNCYSIR